MAFDDLDQAEQAESASGPQDGADGHDVPDASDSGAVATDAESDTDTASRSDESSPGGVAESPAVDSSGSGPNSAATSEPAFGFEEAKQRPLYARRRAWDAFEDALAIDVEPTLRRHDLRDASKRELHDAALRVLADHADEVADKVLEARGVRPETDTK